MELHDTVYHFEVELEDEHFAGEAYVQFTIEAPDPDVGFDGGVECLIKGIKGFITDDKHVEMEVELIPNGRRFKEIEAMIQAGVEEFCWETYREDIQPYEKVAPWDR
jgi:hypothetical protein